MPPVAKLPSGTIATEYSFQEKDQFDHIQNFDTHQQDMVIMEKIKMENRQIESVSDLEMVVDHEKKNTTLEQMSKKEDRNLKRMQDAVQVLLECIGENGDREGLKDTPLRMAKSLLFCTKGYKEDLTSIINGAIFTENHSEMVIVKDIQLFSLCEHHMVPFTGKVSIGYIPNGKIIGLSKIARIVEMFARRLQVQERLSTQIATALMDSINPLGVGVVIEASHMCMTMRGVQKPGAVTITHCFLGSFKEDRLLRSEFFGSVNRN